MTENARASLTFHAMGILLTGEHTVHISLEGISLSGILHVPAGAQGMVLFAHGAGSSRFSPRNQFVAKILREKNIGTLLFDLLTKEEEIEEMDTAHLRFNIPLLSKRLEKATDWVLKERKLSIGYFGASTGAAAALMAAARKGSIIRAVVSRGGRPDLAGKEILRVTAPTLLIVGGNDTIAIELNRKAFEELKSEKKLAIIPDASHLFEEKGTLEAAAEMAADWFQKFLRT